MNMKTHCKWGHEIAAVGRYASGGCRACALARAREWEAKNMDRKRETARAWAIENRAIRAAQSRVWAAENTERRRAQTRLATRRAKMVGLPDVEARPGHICECCHRPISSEPCADHDHSTKMFRGWLCHQCNIGLSHVERPGFVERARAYLARFQPKPL